jgi:hypothetical protein
MPRDVTTRWNSTYDMLDFAVVHKSVVNAMTNDVDNNLRTYEMNTREWGFAEELRDVLKVRARATRAILINVQRSNVSTLTEECHS